MAKSNVLASIMVVVVVGLLLLQQGPAAMAARCGEGDCLKLYTDGGEVGEGGEGRVGQDYALTGGVTSNIFSLSLKLEYSGSSQTSGFKCTGSAGGLFTPGFGSLINPKLSSDNIYGLVQDARTFNFLATSVFLDFTIYGSGGKTLGKVTTGALSFVNGFGSGSMTCEFVS